MIPAHLLEEIREDPFLQYMHRDVIRFDNYLEQTSRISIFIKGIRYAHGAATCEPVAVDEDIGYTTRWTQKYDHRILWKLYNLKYYYETHPECMPKYTMMITSTGTHATPRNPNRKGITHMQFLGKFHPAHKKQKWMVKEYLGKQDYLSILEGHPTSGYVHSHDLYFLYEKPEQRILDVITNHWVKTQGMGNKEHGIEIRVKEPQDFKEIQSLIAYPMSYVGKTTIGNLPEWNKYDVIFNTCLWLSPFPQKQLKIGIPRGIGTRVRAFQPSRSLSLIMNREYGAESIKTDYTHIETALRPSKEWENIITYQAPNYEQNLEAWHNLTGEL